MATNATAVNKPIVRIAVSIPAFCRRLARGTSPGKENGCSTVKAKVFWFCFAKKNRLSLL
jgi:hypothetical protein